MNAGRFAFFVIALVLGVALWSWTGQSALLDRASIEPERSARMASDEPERDTGVGTIERAAVESVSIEVDSAGPRTHEPRAKPGTVPTEPGVLEVEVWLADDPLPGAEVWVAPSDRVEFWKEDADFAHPDIRRGRADENGLARLFPVAPSSGYCSVLVRAGETDAFASVEAPEPDRQGWRVVIRMGSGGIEGRVFHDDGTPWPGCLVQVGVMLAESNTFGRSAETDESGAYRIGSLPMCSAHVSLQSDGAQALLEANVTLAEHEWKRVDFGSDRPKSHWTGRLTTGSGSPLEAELHIRLEDLERGNVYRMGTLRDGTFAIDLVPGRYRAIAFLSRGPRVMDEFQIEGAFVERNIRILDSTIQGRITYVGSWPDKDLPARTAQVWLKYQNKPHLSDLASRDGDRYLFLGVEAGDYRITTHPQALVGGDAEGIPVVITSERSVVDLDLTIQDP